MTFYATFQVALVDTYKSMGWEWIHPRGLKELAEELAKLLSII